MTGLSPFPETRPHADAVGDVTRKGIHDRGHAVQPFAPVERDQRTPRTVMARAEDAHHALGMPARQRACVENRAWRPGVLPVEKRLRASVGEHRPEAERASEVAIHVVPPVVDDPAVRQHRRARFVEVVASELAKVGAVRVNAEEVPLKMPIATAVLHVPVGREHDAPVRQVAGINVRASAVREPFQSRAVRAHLPDRKVLGRRLPHGEEQPARVPRHFEVANHALRAIQQGRDVRPVEASDRRAGPHIVARNISGREVGARVVMINGVLPPRHVDDRRQSRMRQDNHAERDQQRTSRLSVYGHVVSRLETAISRAECYGDTFRTYSASAAQHQMSGACPCRSPVMRRRLS